MKNKARYLAIVLVMAMAIAMLSGAGFAASNTTPTLDIAYCNLSFRSNICIKYAVDTDSNATKVLVWTSPQTDYTIGTEDAVLSTVGNEEYEGKVYKVFDYTDLTVSQMTDVVYARAYLNDGTTEIYGKVKKYSILQYAYNKLGKTATATTDQKLINALNEMLEFGAAMQIYNNYKTETLATDAFAQVKLTAGTLPDGFARGLYKVGTSVTITAPETDSNSVPFSHWEDKNGAVAGTTATYNLTVGAENNTYTPVYGEPETGSPLEFETNGDGTCVVVGIGECTDTKVVIPAKSPDGDTVIGIEGSAFKNETFTSISIPATVEYVARNAFSGCTALTDVYYDGTEEEWNTKVDVNGTGNSALTGATMHFKAAPVATFTVTFKDYNGATLKTETVNQGAAATAPADPERNGYTFTGWDKAFTNITEDTTVTAQYTFASSEPTIVVDSVKATAGQQSVEVAVLLHNAPDIAAMSLIVEYDAAALTLTEVTNGTALASLSYIPSASLASGGTWNWLDTSMQGTPEDGVLMTLKFNISTAASADNYPITISYRDGTILDKNETPLNIAINNATVTVSQ